MRRILQAIFLSEMNFIHSRYDFAMTRKTAYLSLCLMLLGAAAQSLGQSVPNPQQQVEAHLRKAHQLLLENEPQAAIPEFRAAVALEPSNIDALGNLGVLLLFQGNYAAALPELRTALRLKPDLWKIQALLGMGERRTGDMADARTDLEAAFPKLTAPKVRVQAGLELIEIYSASGDLDKASVVVDSLQAIAPENQEVLYAAYRIHSDLAREAILSLSLVAPKSALMYQAAAHVAAMRSDTAGAIRDYRQALKLNPKLPGLHFELAEMLNSQPPTSKEHDEAKSEYEAALAQNPFDEKADLRLAEIATLVNDRQTAIRLYSRALQVQPDDPEANYELGKMLFTMNQLKRSEELLEHAVQLNPTNDVYHFRLSTVYHRLGRSADADREAKLYEKYRDLKQQMLATWRTLNFDPNRPGLDQVDLTK